jgi:uncharacterized protein YaiI (UPF0178 family)
MKIWVDADACPARVKEVLFRAAERTQISVTLVANHGMSIPALKLISFLQVPQGFDMADNEIVKRAAPGDLVITADIPLAAELIDKEVQVLNPRGELYTIENIKARLKVRDLMDTLRASGIQTGGPKPLGPKEQQAFANQLDKILTRYLRKRK